jgi:hypothetical protein
VALLAAVIAAVPGAAAAALPVGSPKSLRQARAADAVARGAEMERWSVDFINPRTREHVTVLVFQRGPLSGRSAYGEVFDSRWAPFGGTEVSVMVEPASGRRLEWRGSDLIALTRKGSLWRLRVEAAGVGTGGVTADALLRRTRAGITAGRWRLPPWSKGRAGRLSWALPVATSRASGRIRVGTHERNLDGWRASIEHAWASQPLWPLNYDNWETAVVHTRRGGAWVLQGINRADYLTGPGARDAFWLGVRARVGAGAPRICRPRLDHRAWLNRIGARTRETRTTRCGGHVVTFRNPLDVSVRSDRAEEGFVTYPATTNLGGPGWVRWIGRGLPFGGFPR